MCTCAHVHTNNTTQGVEPTGKKVRVPLIVVVKFEPGTDKLCAERIYWDQVRSMACANLGMRFKVF
jgi:hypothetical protein